MRTRNRAAVQAVILLLVFASCTQEPGPFDAYKQANLIAVPTLAFSASGKWVPDDASGVYMGFEAVSGAGYEPPADHSGAEVYRLEIKNLLPNGDFSQVPLGGWYVYDGSNGNAAPPTFVVETFALNNLMGGSVLHLTAPYSTNYFRLSLRDSTYGMRDGLCQYATYLPRFKYLTNNYGMITEYGADTEPTFVNTWKVGGAAGGADAAIGEAFLCLNVFPTARLLLDTFPSIYVEAETNPYYSFGSLDLAYRQAQEAYVDDLRIVRIDKPFHVRLTLSAQGQASMDLVPGNYRFSVYVKRDPSVGTSSGYDRFHAAGITLTAKRKMGDTTVSAVQAFDDPDKDNDGGAQLWKDWTLLSVDLENLSQEAELSTMTMALSITPTDDTGAMTMDCGSILLTVPRLEMFPDGF